MKNTLSNLPLISIVIPSRNEEEDIAITLDCILAIDYPNKEIIVVDDSSDETPAIVRGYANRGVRLEHRDINSNGCCGARNHGMKHSKGEILVIMNADVRPGKDFLNRIIPHYENGADYLVVRSKAMNYNNIWGKLVASKENQNVQFWDKNEWSEGFSCRREVAEKVGYIPGDFPIKFCRDWMFGANLNKAGYKKHVDITIEINHLVPERLSAFWHERIWRGGFSAPSYFYFRQRNLLIITMREVLKSIRSLFILLLIFPKLYEAIKLSKFSSNGFHDIGTLYLATCVETMALTVGNYKGLLKLLSNKER